MNSGTSVPSLPAPLPAFLWFWLAVYLLTLPGRVLSLKVMGDNLVRQGLAVGGILNTAAVLEAAPLLVVLVGVGSIFLPWIRAAWVERRFRLTSAPDEPVVNEIRAFLGEHAPGLTVRANLLYTRDLAFIYPLGFRTVAIAIFGGLVKLWRGDRAAAEAVLLHEVAHYRQGDALAVGAGSLLHFLLHRWAALYLALVLLPLWVVWTTDRIAAIQEILAPGALGIRLSARQVAEQLLQQAFMLSTHGIIPISLALLFWTAGVLVLPVAAIWSAELSADHFVVKMRGSADGLLRALGIHSQTPAWGRWILIHATHPPTALRRWLAARAEREGAVLVLLMVLPLAYLIRMGLYVLHALPAHAMTQDVASVGVALWGGVQSYLRTTAGIWLAMAGFVLLWPRLSPYWVTLFVRSRPPRPIERTAPRVYAAAAMLVGMLGVVGLVADGTAAGRLRGERAAAPIQETWVKGDRVEVEWQGKWWPARILDVENGSYFVHYEGFDSKWDEWVPPLRVRKSSQ